MPSFFIVGGADHVKRVEIIGSEEEMASNKDQSVVGMWVTEDRYIWQELLSNSRYDEARGNKKSAYQGRYEMNDDHIHYWDDTGFEADGDFIEGVLHHVGMKFFREGK